MEKTRIKELRKQKKLTQIRLSIALEINQNNLSRYETDQCEADYSTLIKIANYFGVSVDYLLRQTDNPKRNL